MSSQARRQPPPVVVGSEPVRRRRRGAARLSCAECRRLKLRCDRKVPCDSCVKRGCAAICPDGSLTTGKGNRFVLASTQDLHEKISELCSRVRELEDALREAHVRLSPQGHPPQQHPLLTEDLLRIKMPLQRETPSERYGNGIKEEPADVVDSFGSLSIGQSGRTKYYGHVANSWYFLQNESVGEQAEDRIPQLESILPPELLSFGSALPPTSATSSPLSPIGERLKGLLWYLPAAEKAAKLRDIYYDRAAWMYNPISRSQFDEQVYTRIYYPDSSSPVTSLLPGEAGDDETTTSSHRLALMFMVLAVGTLLDPSLPAYNLESEKYHQLARAALFQGTTFDDPTLTAVQAVFLMTFYLFLSDRHGTSSGSRWTIMGIAVKLAQSIGLHRDSTRWGMEDEESQRRRATFWELYVYDSWQCMTFGRPPSFYLAHIDCKMPYPLNDETGENTFEAWKHRFASECLSIVHDQAFGARGASYQTIVNLDRKIRAFPVPAILQVAGFGNMDPNIKSSCPDTLPLIMQRHIVLAIRETNLLYMHRGFFARAITDHPKDPLGSPYGTSVIAAYRSAGSLVALVRNLSSQVPEPTQRLWFLWTHIFSCAIVLGSIVTRCPSMSLAPSALVQLDSACELFASTAPNFRAEKVLNIMRGLREKAHIALREFKEGRTSQLAGYGSLTGTAETGSPEPTEDDELTKLGGKTRFVSSKDYSKSPSPQMSNRSPNSLNPIVPLPLPTSEVNNPHVVAYLQTFAPTQMHASSSQSIMQMDGAYQQQPLGGYGNHERPVLTLSSFDQANGTSAPLYDPSFRHGHSGSFDSNHSPISGGSDTRGVDLMGGAASSSLHTPHHPQQAAQNQMFPQYFPVFDYGNAGGDMAYNQLGMQGNGGLSNGHVNGFDHDMGGIYPQAQFQGYVPYTNGTGDRPQRSSLSPEMTMQNNWNELVAHWSVN